MPDTFAVGAILHTGGERYLMQLRDNAPHVSMPNHWGLFGGLVEKDEEPEQSLLRELAEELSYVPATKPARFTDLRFNLAFAGHGIHQKIFYSLRVTAKELRAMRLGEGQEMRLFTWEELLSQSNILPWDAFGVLMFARRNSLRTNLRRYR